MSFNPPNPDECKQMQMHCHTMQVGLARDISGAKEVFLRLISDVRAQEQAKCAAKEAENRKVRCCGRREEL